MKTAERKTLRERGGVKLCCDSVSRDGIVVAARYFVSMPKPGKPGVVEQHYYDHLREAERREPQNLRGQSSARVYAGAER